MLSYYVRYLLKRYYRGKNWHSQNFPGLKNVSPCQFWGAPLMQVTLNFKISWCNLKIRGLGANLCAAFLYFHFERNYGVLKSKSPCILLSKNINFNKNGIESKMENSTHSFRETNPVLQLLYELQIKVKLWWVGAHKRKKEDFLYHLFCPKEFFLRFVF